MGKRHFVAGWICLCALPALASGAVCSRHDGSACPHPLFCEQPLGDCLGELAGTCRNAPASCPDDFDPVCGCNERTYRNACRAAREGVSLATEGACAIDDFTLVRDLAFGRQTLLRWRTIDLDFPVTYNLYIKPRGAAPPADMGHCSLSGMVVGEVELPAAPGPGTLWLLQLTGVFADGEGPMGASSSGAVRLPAEPCACTRLPDPGPCTEFLGRYAYHDFSSRECALFDWGGCGGNANRFLDLARCEEACTATCGIPPDPGFCAAAIPRWFHDPLTGECHPFVWGGCGGNANNFETSEACDGRCGMIGFSAGVRSRESPRRRPPLRDVRPDLSTRGMSGRARMPPMCRLGRSFGNTSTASPRPARACP